MSTTSDWDMNRLFKITRMIHNDESAARILAELFVEPATAQELCEKCDISPVKCLHTLRKLKKNRLISIVRTITPGTDTGESAFRYKSILDPRYVKFEDGRIKVKLPGALKRSDNPERDISGILEKYSDK